jgi:hypothetical protein
MLSKTELVWDGKYDAQGKRVAPLRVALPFQTVETVNESAQDREKNLFQLADQEQPWRNRLIWGDKKYVLPALLAAQEVRAAVKHWSQWVDYWAVDWDHRGGPFHNQWQTFRTRQEPKLALSAAHTYAEKGEYRVTVKVIDILWNDTTKTVTVKVK